MSTIKKTRAARSSASNGSPRNVTPLKRMESLERLRDHVEAAAEEILNLRNENAEMASSVNELSSRIAEHQSRVSVSFEDDAKALRKKVRGFINAIDEYLDLEGNE